MAQYKDSSNVTYSSSSDFDTRHSPGSEAKSAGIYRCPACGDEIGIAKGHNLPPQNNHQHPSNARVEWQLLVRAVQK